MKKITYFCDSCGSEIVNFPIKITIEYVDRLNQELSVDKEEEFMAQIQSKEYCVECAKAAFETVRPLRRKPEEAKPKIATQKAKKSETNVEASEPKRVKYDHGKIGALRNAGWSWEKIKDEIAPLDDNVTPDKIAKAHYAYRHKVAPVQP